VLQQEAADISRRLCETVWTHRKPVPKTNPRSITISDDCTRTSPDRERRRRDFKRQNSRRGFCWILVLIRRRQPLHTQPSSHGSAFLDIQPEDAVNARTTCAKQPTEDTVENSMINVSSLTPTSPKTHLFTTMFDSVAVHIPDIYPSSSSSSPLTCLMGFVAPWGCASRESSLSKERGHPEHHLLPGAGIRVHILPLS